MDYPQKDVLPEMLVDCELRQPPEDTHLMNLVLVETMDKMIEDECKANCEACQVNSDSQFDHCGEGNCLKILIMLNCMLDQHEKRLRSVI